VAEGTDGDAGGHVEVAAALGVEELAAAPVGEHEGRGAVISVEVSLGEVEERAGHGDVLPPTGDPLTPEAHWQSFPALL
jgi:hypothetical protein